MDMEYEYEYEYIYMCVYYYLTSFFYMCTYIYFYMNICNFYKTNKVTTILYFLYGLTWNTLCYMNVYFNFENQKSRNKKKKRNEKQKRISIFIYSLSIIVHLCKNQTYIHIYINAILNFVNMIREKASSCNLSPPMRH